MSSGVAQVVSAFPSLFPYRAWIAIVLVMAVMVINLRGVRESGTVVAVPTFFFIAAMYATVGIAMIRQLAGTLGTVPSPPPLEIEVAGPITLFLLLHAFSSGTTALTGVEAISNGIPAFKEPRSRNAGVTLLWMSAILASLFLAISYLALHIHAVPSETETLISQLARTAFAGRGVPYLGVIGATTLILIMAANTAYAGFPRLAALQAADGYLPRQLTYRGSRLVYSRGILVLALVASFLIWVFDASVTALIPLYAIGVFTAFTLSQSGMVRHWLVERGPGWRRSAIINGTGAVATGIVTVVFAIAKFGLGAWVVIVIVPLLVIAMLLIQREYSGAQVELYVRPDVLIGPPSRGQRVVVPLVGMRRDAIQAIKFGLTLSDRIIAVHVTDDLEAAEQLRAQFDRQVAGVQLVIVESPYRELVQPFIRYLEVTAAKDPSTVTIVLLPERIIRHWWERFLYNQNAHRIRDALTGRPGILVADIPFRREV
jgi:amino acid transporter